MAVVTDENPHRMGVFENKIEIINGVSSVSLTSYNHVNLDPEKEGRIIDVKFLNDYVVVMLCQPEGMCKVVGMELEMKYLQEHANALPTTGQPPVLFCSPYRSATGVQVARRLEFKWDLAGFVPARMEVMEASDSRDGVPARVCLLDRDGVSYKVFALPPQEELLAAP